MSTLTQQKPDIGAVCSEPSKASTLSKQPEKYRLNHAAAEFISSDSSASSMISEKSEGEEEFVGATVAVPQPDKEEGGRVSQQQGHAEGGASSAAGPRRRALGWESPQGILPMGHHHHHPYGHMSYGQYVTMMHPPGSPTATVSQGEYENDPDGDEGHHQSGDMYYVHQYPYGPPFHQMMGGSPPHTMMMGGSPPPAPGFFSVPVNVPSDGRQSPPVSAMYACSPPFHGGPSPPGGQYYYVPQHQGSTEYDVSQHMNRMNLMTKAPSHTSMSSLDGLSPEKKKAGEARASARIARSNRAGGAYNPSDFQFDKEEALSHDTDARKTIMIRNIPNKYGQDTMIAMLDKCGLSATFDFFYLPKDFRNGAGLGYAFINFIDAKHAVKLYDTFHNKRWDEYNSKKVCEIKYARVQGRDNLINHFKTAKFPSSDREYLPLIYEHQQTVSGKYVVDSNSALTIHEYLAKNSL